MYYENKRYVLCQVITTPSIYIEDNIFRPVCRAMIIEIRFDEDVTMEEKISREERILGLSRIWRDVKYCFARIGTGINKNIGES